MFARPTSRSIIAIAVGPSDLFGACSSSELSSSSSFARVFEVYLFLPFPIAFVPTLCACPNTISSLLYILSSMFYSRYSLSSRSCGVACAGFWPCKRFSSVYILFSRSLFTSCCVCNAYLCALHAYSILFSTILYRFSSVLSHVGSWVALVDGPAVDGAVCFWALISLMAFASWLTSAVVLLRVSNCWSISFCR